MHINTSKPQGRPRNLSDIPRQQLMELGEAEPLRPILDATDSTNVGGMQCELQALAEGGTRRGIAGGVVMAGAAGVLAWQGTLTGTALSLCASVAGLGGLGLLGAGLWKNLQAKSDLKTLESQASLVEEKSVRTQDGKVEDRRFHTGMGLESALEVSDAATGLVVERSVQAGKLKVEEDVAQGLITLSIEGQKMSFPGILDLPTAQSSKATITHTLKNPSQQIDRTTLELGLYGEHALRLTGPSLNDDEGFPYDPGFSILSSEGSDKIPNADNTWRYGLDEGVWTLQSPLDLAEFAAGNLKLAERRLLEPMEASLAAPVPEPEPPMPLGDFVRVQAQAARMLNLRSQACRRYLDTEVRYANFHASASDIEVHKAELKDLDESWKLLPSRPSPDEVALVSDTAQLSKLTSLQLDLLEVRGQALGIQSEAGWVRDGLYQATGPKLAAGKLLEDVKVELARVETLLKKS